MDVDDDNSNNNSDIWEWQEEEYCLQRDSRNEVSHCLWDEVNVNEENFMYMLDEPTPIKDCLDLDYQLSDVGDNSKNGVEECTETSQMKRRRMLQFTTSDTNNIGIDNQQFTSVREGSLTEDVPSHNLEWGAEWNLELHEGTALFSSEGWNRPPEGTLANCVNESEMHCSTNEMTDYIPDSQVGISEVYNISPQMETDLVQNTPSSASIKVYKGRKSYLRTPKKLATPVAYPFALIKPCGVQGDVTLGDINQRIHAPPPSRSKHLKDDNPSSPYLTSAFSGKPVVVKTKIRTEGGRGSITIMRTKG